jgi:hypothetical protein
MKIEALHVSAFIGLGLTLAVLTGCRCQKGSTDGRPSDGIVRIKQQPKSQLVRRGDSADFDVRLVGPSLRGARHRWFFNGNLIDSEEAAKALGWSSFDQPHLHINKVSSANVGFYSYFLETEDKKGYHALHSERIELLMWAEGSTVVYGTPIAGPDGSGTACPGPYVGYVSFTNPGDPSGGWYFRSGGRAYDKSAGADTVVRYFGVPYTNCRCDTNVPASPYPYRFTVYFRSHLPTGAYPITLEINP